MNWDDLEMALTSNAGEWTCLVDHAEQSTENHFRLSYVMGHEVPGRRGGWRDFNRQQRDTARSGAPGTIDFHSGSC